MVDFSKLIAHYDIGKINQRFQSYIKAMEENRMISQLIQRRP
jgi:hypothetical protein